MASRPSPTSSTDRAHAALGAHAGVKLVGVAAFASFVLSVVLWFTGSEAEGIFVGLWVPSILAAGAFWCAAVGGSRR